MTDNTNPGNFANRYLYHASIRTSIRHAADGPSPKDEVREIASKGGKASHTGGFASMDADKQVSPRPIYSSSNPARYVLRFGTVPNSALVSPTKA
ncbi:hypothetical protein CDD80_1234 [Ophiocordyceps camponoti-rufipedis]|uniref:Uncharacterized protein n=1 Tax=Ophiocordyceps camponoti-rufipedis TaxID=2004952 RepID=A0A2C5X9M1_9HYPO|nr:hypothetical protein CDD80_1234 [Ophiocordyceps camponoti-rufipedis]